MSATQDFRRGLALAGRGVGHALGDGRALRSCWPLALAGAGITLLLQAAGVVLVLRYVRSDDAAGWLAAAWVLARVVLVIAALGGGALLGLLLTALLLPLLAERILLTSLRSLDPERAARLSALTGLPLEAQVVNAVRRLVAFVAFALLGLALSFVPLLGLVLGPATEALVGARFLSWELLEPWMTLTGRSHERQRALLARTRALLMGFALPFVPLLAIPLVGPFAFAIAQAAAALLLHEESSHFSDQAD